DFNRGGQSFAASEGNGYSDSVRFDHKPDASAPISLVVNHIFHERPFQETARIKLANMESKLLSSFYRRPVHMHAAVVLPKSFAYTPNRRFPVIYSIPGFGGSHYGPTRDPQRAEGLTDVDGVEMLYVVLDPRCSLGHHVFADSDNNGPWGQALVTEFIPFIE